MSDGPPSVEGYDSADATFNEALQIDMKGLFGDTVGNVSGVLLRRQTQALLTSDPKDEHQSDQSRRRTGRVSIIGILLSHGLIASLDGKDFLSST